MSSEEEALTTLYAQRQDILKQLAEVDTNIKALESQMQEKNSANAKSRSEKAIGDDGNADVDKVTQLIVGCMKDANGLRDALKVADACKYIQESLDTSGFVRTEKSHFRTVFIHEAVAHALELSSDPNGSEFMQQVISLLTSGTTPAKLREVEYDITPYAPEPKASERMLLIEHLGQDFVTICCSTSGARVSQKVIDSLATAEEFDVLSRNISSSIVVLAKDINGNHSLAKLISSPKLKSLSQAMEDNALIQQVHKNIYESISENCIGICKNRQGCCIIQKCLQWAPEPYYTTIISTVLNNALKLVQDPFGNYVVQFILDRHQDLGPSVGEKDSTNHTNQIIRQMLHHVAELSCNKFSSNVIEKCLKTASPDVRQLLVDELTDPQVLPKLLTDSFANYVIQTAISTASDDGQFTQLRDSIMPLQDLLKNSPYGVKIEMKLSRRHREAARKQSKKKDSTSAMPPPAMPHQQHQHQQQEGVASHAFLQGMPAIVQQDGMGQQVAFANIQPDMSSIFQQQQMMGTMPFMLPGQPVLGFPNGQSSFMGMISGNGLHQEFR